MARGHSTAFAMSPCRSSPRAPPLASPSPSSQPSNCSTSSLFSPAVAPPTAQNRSRFTSLTWPSPVTDLDTLPQSRWCYSPSQPSWPTGLPIFFVGGRPTCERASIEPDYTWASTRRVVGHGCVYRSHLHCAGQRVQESIANSLHPPRATRAVHLGEHRQCPVPTRCPHSNRASQLDRRDGSDPPCSYPPPRRPKFLDFGAHRLGEIGVDCALCARAHDSTTGWATTNRVTAAERRSRKQLRGGDPLEYRWRVHVFRCVCVCRVPPNRATGCHRCGSNGRCQGAAGGGDDRHSAATPPNSDRGGFSWDFGCGMISSTRSLSSAHCKGRPSPPVSTSPWGSTQPITDSSSESCSSLPLSRSWAIWSHSVNSFTVSCQEHKKDECVTSVASRIRCRRLRAAIGAQRKAHRAANTERIGKRCNAALRFDGQRGPTDDR